MADTFEQLTADTICAPFFMMAECSALVPTMKPVTLCRKIMGVLLLSVKIIFHNSEADVLLTIDCKVG